MPTYIAMLRGINVSGQKLIKMERLRASLEALGFDEVRTYIQSGNVVFKAAKQSADGLAKKIADKILRDFGFPVPVLIRAADEMSAAVKANPFLKDAGNNESKLHVTFLSDNAPATAEKTLAVLAAKSERFKISGREIYLCFPDGYGSTKLSNSAIEKKLSVSATTRNWITVNVLLAMTQP
jgi:uncharacterized protein (DUF1697 family)